MNYPAFALTRFPICSSFSHSPHAAVLLFLSSVDELLKRVLAIVRYPHPFASQLSEFGFGLYTHFLLAIFIRDSKENIGCHNCRATVVGAGRPVPRNCSSSELTVHVWYTYSTRARTSPGHVYHTCGTRVCISGLVSDSESYFGGFSGFQVSGPSFRVLGLFDYELGTQAEYGSLRPACLISRSGREAPFVVPVVVHSSSNPR